MIYSDGVALQCGFTTGTAATIAAKAATITLLSREIMETCRVMTQKGILVEAIVELVEQREDTVIYRVQKDGGDDVDATHGMYLYALVEKIISEREIIIDGGIGIGRVTKKGLNQPIGAAAINDGPRRSITKALEEVRKRFGYEAGLKVTIYAPEGEEVAKKTFNANLGILGGISILGTTGIVEPRSVKALVDSIEVEVKMHQANGIKRLIVSPGNYSDTYIENNVIAENIPNLKSSNFIGDTIDILNRYGMEEILFVGHIGKFVKLAAGIMNTHSRQADGRVHIFAAYAALCGGKQSCIQEIMESATTDACIDLLKEEALLESVLRLLVKDIQIQLEKRCLAKVGVVLFSNVHGSLGQSKEAIELLQKWKTEGN